MYEAPNAITSALAAFAIVAVILLGVMGGWALLTSGSPERELSIELPDNRNR